MPLPHASAATLALTRVLDELGVPCLVAGALASSYHGIPRSTADANLVAALGAEQQWNDVLGVIKVKRRDLDLAYLRQAAAALAVSDLLDRALADSGGA
jgi:hypothetical protein